MPKSYDYDDIYGPLRDRLVDFESPRLRRARCCFYCEESDKRGTYCSKFERPSNPWLVCKAYNPILQAIVKAKKNRKKKEEAE